MSPTIAKIPVRNKINPIYMAVFKDQRKISYSKGEAGYSGT
jgi:hypothetical protein